MFCCYYYCTCYFLFKFSDYVIGLSKKSSHIDNIAQIHKIANLHLSFYSLFKNLQGKSLPMKKASKVFFYWE